MAETESPEINCVYVETNLYTRLVLLVHNNETISDFKEKLHNEHHQCFPKLGEINISAVKVKRQNTSGLLLDFHLPDSMYLSMAFDGVSSNCWFLFVDATVSVVDKCDLMDDADEKNKEIATDSLVLDGYTKKQSIGEDLGTQVAEKMTKKRKLRSSDGGKSKKNKEIATDSLLLDGYTKNQSPEEDLETPVVEKKRKKRKLKDLDGETSVKKPLVDVIQSAADDDAMTVSRFDVDGSHELRGNVVSGSSPREKLDDMLTETTGKEIEMGEKSVEDLGGDKTENNDLVSHPVNLVDTSSGLTTRPDTEKKKRRKKRSEDDINQSSATVGEIGLPENVDRVDATPQSLLISGDNPLAEASQKENDMAVDDVARDKAETDNLEGHTEIHLDSNNVEEDINQSSAAIITSGDIVNQINEVPANVDHVDAAPESLPISRGENLDNHFAEASQKDTEMVEKYVEDEGRDTEKKKKRKKRSKDDINQSPASAAIATSVDIVNEINEVPANVDPVDATPASLPMSRDTFAESSQKGNEIVEKIDDDVGSGAVPSAAENIQKNEMVEKIDDDGAKSVKTTKKKTSKKAKTPAKEDTVVASGAENVEAIKAVDAEGTDNVIRNVLDSLQEKNETEGILDKTEKKSSKKPKKKHSSKVVESQVLSVEVNNAALEETPLVNNLKDTDALFMTPIKKDTGSDASLLKKSPEIAEDNSLSKKIPVEKVDMVDNFGSSPNQEKQNQVAGGAKSKKQKKGLDLHPSGSIAGSVSSMKPKEKKIRGQQPASSGATHSQSVVKKGRSGSVKTTVSSKKKEVKKSSKPPVAVDNKRKTNFFENAENCNSSEDEYKKISDVSTKTPSDYSSDNDSDVTSMSRKQQGNNLAGGANKFEGSLQDLLRRSSSYKKALIRAQSQPDIDDDSPVDCVPDSQGL